MPPEIKIPFGYKRIIGQTMRGDGIWNGERFVRVKRVKRKWPVTDCFMVVIRRAKVEQGEMALEA